MQKPKQNKLVNRTKLGNAVRNDLNNALNKLAEDTDIPKSKLLDRAIELLLEEHNRLPKKD